MTTVRYSRSEWTTCLSDLKPFDYNDYTVAIPQEELSDIYWPLVHFIENWRQASKARQTAIEESLGLQSSKPAPFLIGIAGSVAAGKSTTSRLIADLISLYLPNLKVDIISTDHFLYSNAELQTRGIMNQKGFPKSYDWDNLQRVLSDLKSGKNEIETPIYSHEVYDITGETATYHKPDIVLLEGINVLQAGNGFRPISDWLDFKLYVDAEEPFVFNWYWKRVQNLVKHAEHNPSSYFSQFQTMDKEALFSFSKRIWRDINAVNLKDYILPSRERADVILKKAEDHTIQEIIINL